MAMFLFVRALVIYLSVCLWTLTIAFLDFKETEFIWQCQFLGLVIVFHFWLNRACRKKTILFCGIISFLGIFLITQPTFSQNELAISTTHAAIFALLSSVFGFVGWVLTLYMKPTDTEQVTTSWIHFEMFSYLYSTLLFLPVSITIFAYYPKFFTISDSHFAVLYNWDLNWIDIIVCIISGTFAMIAYCCMTRALYLLIIPQWVPLITMGHSALWVVIASTVGLCSHTNYFGWFGILIGVVSVTLPSIRQILREQKNATFSAKQIATEDEEIYLKEDSTEPLATHMWSTDLESQIPLLQQL